MARTFLMAALLNLALVAPAQAQAGRPPISVDPVMQLPYFEPQMDVPRAPRPPGAEDEEPPTGLAFRDDRHERMTVPVHLSGEGPFDFLIDTGADRTVISFDLARRLGLDGGPETILHSVTGATPVRTATVPDLDLKARQLQGFEAALLDKANIGADGILGLDALRSQRIVFDFEQQTLTIVPAARAERDEEGTIVVRAKRRDGRLIVSRARAEGQRVAVVVDTGSEITVGNMALRSRLQKAGLLRPIGRVELLSVTGETLEGDLMFLKRLEFGGVVLAGLAVAFADSHAFRTLDLDDRPAMLLGMNALRGFDKVSIDFADRKLRLVPTNGDLPDRA